MTKQAIIIPYVVDQNEPSFPVRGVFTLPDDKAERDATLRDLFQEHALADDEGVVPTIEDIPADDPREYDIIVYNDIYDVYMYVVFLPNP